VNGDNKSPASVMSVLTVALSAVKVHRTGSALLILQFRRSRFPGITVEPSGQRVNAPSDPEKLNKQFNYRTETARRCII